MSAETAIHFRDPFIYQRRYQHQQQYHPSSWSSYPHHRPDLNRDLTPPLEMNGVSHSNKPISYQQHEHAHDHVHQSHRAGVAPYLFQMLPNLDYSRPSSRAPFSPEQSAKQPPMETARPRSRKSSQAAIAPSFQIPKSINDSGGSLSELAAQMTCLFWFESSEVLEQIEKSPVPLPPSRQLVHDARPTTGFRKWVTTILSTTCVAQNVVLLALLFIHRLKKLNPTVRGKPGSEYRLLTVALMLGNKFLDDNTYTNKTWAEVSGINVAEVHIMEVEFLSNMKYCLFTSAEDWTKWQSLLGKFAAFFDRANRPMPTPSLPPPSSLHQIVSLPSPPSSNQASPPYSADPTSFNGNLPTGPTPAPSPLSVQANANGNVPGGRKRSRDELSISDPPPKRVATGYPNYPISMQYNAPTGHTMPGQQVPRLPLPPLAVAPSQTSSNGFLQPIAQGNQLPPLSIPNRAMTTVYPNSSSQTQIPSLAAVSGIPSSSHNHSQTHSRQQSPYASPGSNMPLSATSLHPPNQLSPTRYYLQQRNSPYRPVHNVSTLVNPPPSSALQHRPQSVEYDQMHYQPLGKPFQQRQTGRLPYVSQNVWLDANTPQAMTPVHQWPSFNGSHGLAQQQRHH